MSSRCDAPLTSTADVAISETMQYGLVGEPVTVNADSVSAVSHNNSIAPDNTKAGQKENSIVEAPEEVGSAQESVKEEKTDNAFAYLDSDVFTAEKFKVKIQNLPKYFGMTEVKKFLNQRLKLEASKVKRPPNSSMLYVCFRSEEAREKAITTLNGHLWKGRVLAAEAAKAIPDPFVMKRQSSGGGGGDGPGGKRIKFEDEGDLLERLKDATTPLWRKDYEEQLKQKSDEARNVLLLLGDYLKAVNPEIIGWIESQGEKYNGLPCELLPIKPSPIKEAYRNKCEFTIGVNDATGEKTVGMRIGSYAKGTLCVVSPQELAHIPDIMKKAAIVAQKYIRASPLDIYNLQTHVGHWKKLTVRYGFRTDELMLMFVLHPQTLQESDFVKMDEELKAFFTSGEGAELKVHSLILATEGRKQDVLPMFRCVLGDGFIHEEVCGFRFQISPQSFFQINTPAAEVLYDSIAELSGVDDNTTLLDICCGSGTIGICLSKKCGEVLGVDIVEEAIKDANRNSQANGIKNAQFFAGKAEQILGDVIRRVTKEKIVAVVDPPRAGLEKNAVAQIRRTRNLDQFVYASCDPRLALKNFMDFGRTPSKQYPCDPFVPIRCVPVDMFPHAKGCEIVIFFQRWSTVSEEGGW